MVLIKEKYWIKTTIYCNVNFQNVSNGGESMSAQMKSLKQNSKSSSIAVFRFIILGWILSGFVFNCIATVEEKQ